MADSLWGGAARDPATDLSAFWWRLLSASRARRAVGGAHVRGRRDASRAAQHGVLGFCSACLREARADARAWRLAAYRNRANDDTESLRTALPITVEWRVPDVAVRVLRKDAEFAWAGSRRHRLHPHRCG